MRPPKYTSLPDRFWSRVDASPDSDCHLWIGAKNSEGYGYFLHEGKQWRVHRLVLVDAGIEIPAGLEIDHLCKTVNCVNRRHLEVVTGRENILRSNAWSGRNARKTHCIHGHEFNEENTYFRSTGGRRCKKCQRDGHHRNAEYRNAKRRARYWARKNDNGNAPALDEC